MIASSLLVVIVLVDIILLGLDSRDKILINFFIRPDRIFPQH